MNKGDRVVSTENSQFTDRQVNELETTEQTVIGEYKDAAPVVQEMATGTIFQKLHSHANFEEIDLSLALSREYQIANFVWTTGDARQTVLSTLNFPKVLFDIPFIREKINGYKFFKAGVRVSIRITANKMSYGKLMVSYVPMAHHAHPKGNILLNQNSGGPHLLLSAAVGDVVVFDIPFISNKRFLTTNAVADNELATVRIQVMNVLKDVQGNTNGATVQVSASFLEPTVMFPHDEPYIVPQSGRAHMQAGRPSVMRPIERVSLKARGDHNAHTSSSIEGSRKALAGITDKIEEYKKPSVPEIGIATLGKIAEKVVDTGLEYAMMGLMLGLDKPKTTAKTTVVKNQPLHDYNSGDGIDCATSFGLSQNNSIDVAPIMAGHDSDEMSLKYVVTTPALLKIIEIKGSTDVMVGKVGPEQIEENDPITFVDWVSSHFAYFSGSYKYKIYITSSQFLTVKLVFYLSDSNSPVQNWQNVYHQVVDVQGDTEVSFMLPYTQSDVMHRAMSNSVHSLWVKAIAFSSPNPVANTPIFLNVYKAGAEDMQFGGQLEKTVKLRSTTVNPVESRFYFVAESAPREDFIQKFDPFHPSFEGYAHSGLVIGENPESVRDYIHRYYPYKGGANGLEMLVYDEGGSTLQSLWGLEMWGNLYRFWRGSVRFKAMCNSSTRYMGMFIWNVPQQCWMSGGVFATPYNNIIEAEVPFYFNKPFCRTWFPDTATQDYENRVAFKGNGYLFVNKAAGDDFSFHFLKLPDSYPTTSSINTYGVQLLQTHMSNY